MDRDPGEFERRDAHDSIDTGSSISGDDLPEMDAETRAAIEDARRDVAAGRVVPHDQVAAWLRTWGTPDHKPMPREWLR